MKTAIEWLEEQLKINNYISDNAHWLIDEAKEMHKQQIIDAWENSYKHGACVNEDKDKYHGSQYYNETFSK